MSPRVLLHGSCVSRDALELAEPGRFALADYHARSCLGSAFAPRGLGGVDTAPNPSAFQRRMVERDLTKAFARRLADGPGVAAAADVVLLDLVDERHDLLVAPDGGVGTRSLELLASGLPADAGWRRVRTGTPEFLASWERGWGRFVVAARAAGVLDRVVVHEARWALGAADGSAFDVPRVTAANVALGYMHARMRRDLPEARFLRVPDRLVVGDPDHRWGPSPVHYAPSYYRAFLDLLEGAAAAVGR